MISLSLECLDDLEQIILALEELKPESKQMIEETFEEIRSEILANFNQKFNP
jgi:hypothetical protein